MSSGKKFVAQSGQQIYQTSWQGCHMLNGQGAVGAGVYPALAGNGNLQSAEYVVHVVLHGKNGMPGFRDLLSEEQLASISNYVRSNLGNSHGAEITADFVQSFSNRK